MINTTLLKIIASREDISEYLFHFTKGKNAFSQLLTILKEGDLRDIHKNGYLCFTEAPLTALYNMFQIFTRYENPMFAPYGIGIKKELLYKIGCRPVIYGTKEDFAFFPKHLNWRCIEYIPGVKDYTWLREWRLKKDIFKLPTNDLIIITKTDIEQTALMESTSTEFVFDVNIEDREPHGNVSGEFKRMYIGISMEEIKNLCYLSKAEMTKILSEQYIGEIEDRFLGYF